jgi:hypothetical protein
MRYRVGRSLLIAIALALAALNTFAAFTFAAKHPEPSLFPVSWELTFKHGSPRRIIVDVPGTSAPAAYWYMTYSITNKTGSDQMFDPASSFELYTPDGKGYRGNFAIRREVFDAIKKRENNPMLESADKISGIIRQGEDEAKDGVAIWKEPASQMRSFNIYVTGLCGEHVMLKDDDGKPMTNTEGQPIILRKTLELTYQVRGSGKGPIDPDQIEAKPEHWVMR